MIIKQPKFRQLKRVFQPAGTITRSKIARISLHLERNERTRHHLKRKDKDTTKYIDTQAQQRLVELQNT